MATNSYIVKLKARLDQAIVQRDHWRSVALRRNVMTVTHTPPGGVPCRWEFNEESLSGLLDLVDKIRADNDRLYNELDAAGETIKKLQALNEALQEVAHAAQARADRDARLGRTAAPPAPESQCEPDTGRT